MSANSHADSERIAKATSARFGEIVAAPVDVPGADELRHMLEHSSHRKWTEQPVDAALLRLLFACALSAPSKSDLQQADIIHVADRAKIKAIADLIPDMPWINNAPVFLVFCGNNRRIRQIGEWRGKPFVNEHLDHFMNAAVDAGIVLSQFIRAAEAVGLGTVPISAVRNHPRETSDILGLPDAVFPVAGLCVGYPLERSYITPRLSLDITTHTDRFDESGLKEKIDAYDQRRHSVHPLRKQRHAKLYPDVAFNGWSEDKARHYSVPERSDFGAFIRDKKFSLK
ncbi:MAG TPA: nitroreductase family protein [Burkholderiales bacterium]|nr:nitroreductase family protein [Burkholderiales bacterium]